MVEKETITFNEFKAWLTGLVVGKKGALPDIDDWKQIKKMMDKVVSEEKIVTIPVPSDPVEPQPIWITQQPVWIAPQPHTGDPQPWEQPVVWCSNGNDLQVSDNMGHHVTINVQEGHQDCFIDETTDWGFHDVSQFDPAQLDAAFRLMFETQESSEV